MNFKTVLETSFLMLVSNGTAKVDIFFNLTNFFNTFFNIFLKFLKMPAKTTEKAYLYAFRRIFTSYGKAIKPFFTLRFRRHPE